MIQLPSVFEKARPVLDRLSSAGYEAYFVGGCVRDYLLNQPISDVDIATSAFPSEVKAVFSRTVDIGIEHGTVLVLWNSEEYEVTTFRTESTYQDFRRPDEVTFVRSLEEDLKRRDFTMNALAMSQDSQMIDLFSGLNDLENRVIRAVGSPQERFSEDALRMMRAVRFVSQLDFTLEDQTAQAILEHHTLLEHIAIERIQVEWMKLLLGKGRQHGLQEFISGELYKYCPHLRHKRDALITFSQFSGSLKNRNQAWTMLLYYLNIQNEEVERFLRDWKCSKQEIRLAKKSISLLRKRLQTSWDNSRLYQSGLSLALDLEELFIAITGQTSCAEIITNQYQTLAIKEKSELQLSGEQLIKAMNIPAGAWLGQLISELEQQVVAGVLPNQQEKLIEWALKYRYPNNETNEVLK